MTILFGTTRSSFPTTSPDIGFTNFVDQAQAVLNGALGLAGARVFNQSFVEDGAQSVNGSVFKGSTMADMDQPSIRGLQTQAPQATIIIKKKMFSSLRANYDVRFLDLEERLFLRAVKHLFRRKCEEIAFYENITNIKKIIADPSFLTIDGILSDALGAIGQAADIGQALGGPIADIISSLESRFPFLNDLQRLQRTNERAKQATHTTWHVDPDQPNFSGTGPGCGTIELTMFTNINTVVSKETGAGSANVSIEDPYQMTFITEADVDIAFGKAVQEIGGQSGVFEQIAKANLETAAELDRQLNSRLRLSGLSEVNFDIPLGTDTKPRGYNIETNESFSIQSFDDPERMAEKFGFGSFEQATILQIFNALESYKSLQLRSNQEFVDQNIRNGPTRQRLRSEFVGHNIIQVMDTIHIFANSFTRQDTPLYAGNPATVGGNFLESVILSDEQAGRLSDQAMDDERQNLAPNLPLGIYKLLRNPIEWRSTGPQIFSGLVEDVQSSYESSHGVFQLSISAKDNYRFLELSQINTTPSLAQPEGVLMDPLTPFDLIKDPATDVVIGQQLSQINKDRLRFLKNSDGTEVQNEQALTNDTGKTAVKVWQHVPGIVYKWKSGIVVSSLNISVGKSGMDPSQINIDDVSDDFGIHVLDSGGISGGAFSNLDPADIISILTTGQPYNYNSFVRNALEVGVLSIDNDTNNRSYFNTLFDFLDRQNQIWGGFVPAKDSALDPQKTASLYARQRQLAKNVTKVNDLQRELAKLKDLQKSTGDKSLNAEISRIGKAIANDAASLSSGDQLTEQSPFRFFGSSVQSELTSDDTKALSGKLRYLVKKKPEEVRYNQDKNYLVISDKYDVDLDIQAYVVNLRQAAPELFKSEWKQSSEICEAVASMLDFELFADSQGNIRFRPPEYNKTPLSLLLKMVELGRSQGISLAPPFLLKMMSERTEMVKEQLLIIELEIIEQALLLGYNLAQVKTLFGVSPAVQTSLIGSDGSKIYILDSSKIIDEGNKNSVFTEAQQQKVVFDEDSTILSADPNQGLKASELIGIRNQLGQLRGSTKPKLTRDPQTLSQIISEMERFNVSKTGSFTNRLAAGNKISQLVSKRQTTIPVLYKLFKNNSSLNATDEGFGLFPSFSVLPEALGSFLDGAPQDTPAIPEFLEDLIENDLANNDGFNSGKRFIINDESILSMNLGVQPPKFTRIDVTGNQNLVDFGSVAGTIGNGAAVLWAGATDFDLWRQYGFRGALPNNKSFLQDPETQCAPYAIFKLVQQRRFIHSGTIKVIGNEHYQVGDVVYVNSRQLMYYVEQVSHSINISNGEFTTTLGLAYGRPLGEYIPTPLDMIGKTLLTNSRRPFSNTKVVRTLTPNNGAIVIETLIIPTTKPIASSERGEIFSMRSQSFKTINAPRIQNAIRRALARVGPENTTARVEVRAYFASIQNIAPDFSGSRVSGAAESGQDPKVAEFFAVQARQLLSGGDLFPPSMLADSNGDPALNPLAGKGSGQDLAIPESKIEFFVIDVSKPLQGDDAKFCRFPSEQAWSNATDPVYGTTSGLPVNSIDIVLVIDRSVKPKGATEEARNAQAASPEVLPPPPDISGEDAVRILSDSSGRPGRAQI